MVNEFDVLQKEIRKLRRILMMVIFLIVGLLGINLGDPGLRSPLLQSTSNRVTSTQFDIKSMQKSLYEIQRTLNDR